jgi:curli production assembly/transport component CsgG
VRIIILLLLLLAGCSSIPIPYTKDCKSNLVECIEDPKQVVLPTFEKLMNLPPAETMPIVAVYSFTDQTGARKRRDGIADFSSAVTQGAATLLIDALKAAGNGTWFRVVERVGIDHLVRERQIVKSTREDFEETRILNPLLFAGMILEGGIIGYDSNIETGGRGARTLGIGGQTQYRRDVVIVSLRAVSTLTGEILLNVQTSKTVLSTALGYDVFKFIDLDTQLIEIEDGITQNESNTYSVRACIEAAVLALIEQGDERKYWKINYPVPEETTDEQTD